MTCVLSTEQNRAVSSSHPHNTIVAGAGSGKTVVLVEQIRRWIEDGIDPASITAITFTRRAGAELVKRLGKVGDSLGYVGTSTAWAYRMLWSYGVRYQVIDDKDLDMVIEYVAERASMTDRIKVSRIRQMVLGVEYSKESQREAAVRAMVSAYLKQHRILHQSEVFARFLRELSTDLEFLAHVRTGAGAIAWDEFQDVDALEARALDAVNPAHSFAVGDTRQAIYGFRGASPDHMRTRRLVGGNHTLRTNYRSTPAIVEYANGLPISGMNPMRAWREDSHYLNYLAGEDFARYLKDIEAPLTILARSNRELYSIRRQVHEEGRTCEIISRRHDPYDSEPWRILYALVKVVLGFKDPWLTGYMAERVDPSFLVPTPYVVVRRLARAAQLGLNDPCLDLTLPTWLHWYATRDIQDMLPDDDARSDVLAMTIHASKGLEFDNVAVWNSDRLLDSEDPDEQRLLYVAVTRARDCLVLHGGE
jgi:superfamily I DNA/RNA helicase